MADTHETIDDIISEKRREANYIVQVAQGKSLTRRDKAEDEARDIRREADRLEAAHRRERGNAAKLREFARLVSHMNDDGYWNGSASICALVGKAKAALAAPPRNCDKFKTSWDVLKEWHEGLDTANDVVKLLDWLFAPATEKEGGNNANE